MQVTLVRAMARVGEFQADREGAFLAYLRRILLNSVRDEIRRSARRPNDPIEDEILASAAPSPLEERIGREALEDVQLGEFTVPRGGQLWMFQWAAHRDPRHFPDPEAFAPERWDHDLARRLPRFAYFPFGGGPRLCIGNNFALLELVLVLATLARRLRPVVRPADRPRPQFSITLRPAGGMRATLERR